MPDLTKLSAPARHLLSSDDLPASVGLMLRLRAEPSDTELLRLEDLGVRVRSIAGDVLTADADPAVLPQLTDEAFVLSVEASAPLYMDAPGEAPTNYSDVE